LSDDTNIDQKKQGIYFAPQLETFDSVPHLDGVHDARVVLLDNDVRSI
jgi:hypothetical protein